MTTATEPTTTRLEAALSWAHIFIREGRRRLEGHPNQLPRAAAQLYFAIEQIDGKVWQRWSRHRTPVSVWAPGCDNFERHFAYVQDWLLLEIER